MDGWWGWWFEGVVVSRRESPSRAGDGRELGLLLCEAYQSVVVDQFRMAGPFPLLRAVPVTCMVARMRFR